MNTSPRQEHLDCEKITPRHHIHVERRVSPSTL
jgi:hypothetical protein